MLKKIWLKIKKWWEKMFGFEVVNDDGIKITGDDIYFSMHEKIVTVNAKTKANLRPNSNQGKVSYIMTPLNNSPCGVSTYLNADNSLHVENATGYPVKFYIVRF